MISINKSLEKVGSRIKQARKKAHLSQVQLAEKLNISVSHMSDIETGSTNFSIEIFMRITEVLQVSADHLLRTDIPQVAAINNREVDSILKGCTPDEIDSLLKMLREMKDALKNAKKSAEEK